MRYEHFGCEKFYIDSISDNVRRNLLIRMYCGHHFQYLNLVDLYYRQMDQNAFAILIFVVFTFPLIYKWIIIVAEKHLAVGMRELSKRLNLSQSFAAVTLIAFGNIAPELVSSIAHSGNSEGTFTVIGVGLGVYVFGMTVSIAIIILASPHRIFLPKKIIKKELLYSASPIIVICLFAYFGHSNLVLCATLLSIYASYIIISFKWNDSVDLHEILHKVEHSSHENKEHVHDHKSNPPSDKKLKPFKTNSAQEEKGASSFVLRQNYNAEHSNKKVENVNQVHWKNNHQFTKSFTLENDMLNDFHKNSNFGLVSLKKEEEVFEFEEKDPDLQQSMANFSEMTKSKFKNYFNHILHEILSEHSSLSNFMSAPLAIALLLTMPYSKNSLMVGRLRYIPLSLFAFVIGGTLTHFKQNLIRLLIFSVGFGLFFLLIDFFKVRESSKMKLHNFATFFVCLAWIKLLVSVLMDYLIFFSFYFSVNEIIVFSVIVSSGNCICEVMATYSLSKAGFGIMAVLSTFSGQFLNLILALSLNIFLSVKQNSNDFDLFGIHQHKNASKISEKSDLEYIFMIAMIVSAFAILIFHAFVYYLNEFRLKKRFATVLLILYGVFLFMTIVFGMKIRKSTLQYQKEEN